MVSENEKKKSFEIKNRKYKNTNSFVLEILVRILPKNFSMNLTKAEPENLGNCLFLHKIVFSSPLYFY